MDRVVPEIEFSSIRNQPKHGFQVNWIRHFLHFFANFVKKKILKVPQQKRKSLVHIASAICSEKTRNPDFGYPIRALILLASSDTSKRIMGDVFTVQGFVWPPLLLLLRKKKKKDTEIFASIFFLPTHFSNLGQAYLAVLKNQLWRFFFLSKIVSDMMCVCE